MAVKKAVKGECSSRCGFWNGLGKAVVGALFVLVFMQGLIMQWEHGSEFDAFILYVIAFALWFVLKRLGIRSTCIEG